MALVEDAVKGQPRPKLSDFIWWHVCKQSKRREYRKHGFDCAQCGAVGPEGRYVADACAFYEHARTIDILLATQTIGVKA